MNLGQLYHAVRKLVEADGEDLTTPVGNKDHFGELETELDGLAVVRKKGNKSAFVALQGMPSAYPEPD